MADGTGEAAEPLARARGREREQRLPLAARVPPAVRLFARDFGLTALVVTAYFVARGLVPDRVEFAARFGAGILEAQRVLGIWWEPAIQEWTLRGKVVTEFANFVYAYLHFPALIGVGVWLWLKDRRAFFTVRNALYLTMPVGLLCYYLFPAAPPRLLPVLGYDVDIRDTVFGPDSVVSYDQPWFFRNDYAAMPSFHFGWMLLVTIAIWAYSRNPAARAFGVFLLVAMTWAILATGNHFILDAVGGGIVVWGAWVAARRLERRHQED